METTLKMPILEWAIHSFCVHDSKICHGHKHSFYIEYTNSCTLAKHLHVSNLDHFMQFGSTKPDIQLWITF